MLTETQKNKKGPLSHQKIKCSILDYVQLLMIGWAIRAKTVDQNIKKQKGPLSYQKIKCSFLDYVQLLMIGWVIQAKNCQPKSKKIKKASLVIEKWNVHFWITFNFWWSAQWSKQKTSTKMQKNEKGPLSHWKIKCLFLDYIQLLMIGQAIQAKNVDWNVKKQKRPLKLSKNKIFIFGLCSTSDDWPINPSKKMMTKMQKNEKGPLSHWKIKCLFFNYINFWWLAKRSE